MHLTDTEALAQFVRERRRELGLTQAELAARTGVGRDWVVRLEQGNPRLEVGLVLDALYALRATPTVGQDSPTQEPSPQDEDDPFAPLFARLRT